MSDLAAVATPSSGTEHELGDLKVRLQERLNGRVQNLRVIFHNCGIVLRGRARTYHSKQLAQHALMNETQLPIVANEIEVR